MRVLPMPVSLACLGQNDAPIHRRSGTRIVLFWKAESLVVRQNALTQKSEEP